jgi:hypothetical protein
MLIGSRRDAFLLLVTLLVCTATVVCTTLTASAAIAQALLPTQSKQLPEPSSDAVVESLERALSEGKAEKAHDPMERQPRLSNAAFLVGFVQEAVARGKLCARNRICGNA